MGITGELVRSVFSRNRSVGTHDSNGRTNSADKSRWTSVRSFLCGDEFNSVIAEEDSASARSSEATVTQPILEDPIDKDDIQTVETKEDVETEKHNLTSKLPCQEDAAIIIQSAFRHFLAKHKSEGNKEKDGIEELAVTTASPSRSVGTSIEVQTGNSVEVLSVQGESTTVYHRMQQKARTQVLKIKEEWDDSYVSSNISKKRIQSRMEATTRRERALAYAFSQQLRICSKKKQQTKSDGTEPNIGWSWLERWMATRLPESSSVESGTSKQPEAVKINHGFTVMKRSFDVAGEEKESCGSNEVSVQFDTFPATPSKEKNDKKPTKNRLKPARTVSRRKTVPSYHCPKEHVKVKTLRKSHGGSSISIKSQCHNP